MKSHLNLLLRMKKKSDKKRDYLLFSLVNSSEVLLSGVGWEFAGGGGGERLVWGGEGGRS